MAATTKNQKNKTSRSKQKSKSPNKFLRFIATHRLAVLFIVVILLAGGGYVVYRSFAATTLKGADGEFTALSPARILDTRIGTGGYNAAIGPDKSITLQVTGKGNVPSANVKAVVANVTVTGASEASHLTLYSSYGRPGTSNINFNANQTIANQVIVPVDTNGQIKIYNNKGNVHVILDVSGYYSTANGTPGGRYNSLTEPVRVYDSRTINWPTGGPFTSAQERVIDVAKNGIPKGATAVVMNVTVTAPTNTSFLTIYPGGTRPTTSNINFLPGQSTSNLVTAKVNPDGTLRVYNSLGSVHVILDVAGYFTEDYKIPALAKSQAGRFVTMQPYRVFDTRYINKGKPSPLTGDRNYLLYGANSGIPSFGVDSVVGNVTVTGGSQDSHLSIVPESEYFGIPPNFSNVNFKKDETKSNMMVTRVGDDFGYQGYSTFFNNQGSVNVITDIVGYYLSDGGYTTNAQVNVMPSGNELLSTTKQYDLNLKFTVSSKAEQKLSAKMADQIIEATDANGQVKFITTGMQFKMTDNQVGNINVACSQENVCTSNVYGVRTENQKSLIIPFVLGYGKTYTIRYDLGGGNLNVKIKNPDTGQYTTLYTVNLQGLSGIKLSKDVGVSLTGDRPTCRRALSEQNVDEIKVSSIRFNGLPIKITNGADIFTDINEYHINEGDSQLCPGFSKVDFALNSGSLSYISAKTNIPAASRDSALPTISVGSIVNNPQPYVDVAASDNQGIAAMRISVQSDTQPAQLVAIDPSQLNKSTVVVPVSLYGQVNTIEIETMDASGNREAKTEIVRR